MIPNLTDAWSILCLISPGYISVVLFHHFWKRKSTLSQLSTLIWTFTASFMIFGVFYVISSLISLPPNTDSITEFIYSFSVPINFCLLFVIMIIVPFLLAKLASIFNFIPEKSSAWSDVFYVKTQKKGGVAIIIYTKDGNEYEGFLDQVAIDTQKQDISISKPLKIIRNTKDEIVSQYSLGSELLFVEEDISRICFLD